MRPLVREEQHDVVIFGGGPAGVCASIILARDGADTLLVEQLGSLGGMATAAMFQPWRGFYSFGRQLVTGLGIEHPLVTSMQLGEAAGKSAAEINGKPANSK